MPDFIAIQIEHVSKQYRLGEISTGTMAHDLNRWWHLVRGKEDPYLKVTQTNVREKKTEDGRQRTEVGGRRSEQRPIGHQSSVSRLQSAPDYVWALRDINFEVKQGEVLGIIGRNGAGKSTLLKILSRVTAPTTGEMRVKGRIASLLEVGTGFHPQLTGRENIYLNGAIYGMRKAEISRRMDDIVDFSGCARYIDTPVKRYSSGMMVRLGFAVAAYLDPEILVVDEVLAVGDAEFQKRCMGKMQDVARQGRTVLFVSHNMVSMSQLTRSCLVLDQGEIAMQAPTDEAIAYYTNQYDVPATSRNLVVIDNSNCEKSLLVDPQVCILALAIYPANGAALSIGTDICIDVRLGALRDVRNLCFSYSLLHVQSGASCSGMTEPLDYCRENGNICTLRLHNMALAPGRYYLHISVAQGGLHQKRHVFHSVLGFGCLVVDPIFADGSLLAEWHPAWGGWVHTNSSLVVTDEDNEQ